MISTLLFIILVSLIYLIFNPIKKKNIIENFQNSDQNKLNLNIQLNNKNVTFYWDIPEDTDFDYFLLYIIPNNEDIPKLKENKNYIPSKKFVKVINSKNGNIFLSKTILNVINSTENKYQIVGYKKNKDGSVSSFQSNTVEIKNKPKTNKENIFKHFPKCEVDGSYHIIYGDPTEKNQETEPNLDSPDYFDSLIKNLNVVKNNHNVEIV